MWRFIAFGLCVLCAGPMVGEGFSQDFPERRTGFTFLLLPTNARDEALGATGVGSVGSAAAMMYNPAGLAFVKRMDASYTYVDWSSSTKKHVAGFAARLPNRGVIGFSVQEFAFEEFVVSNIGGSGTADRSDYAVTGAWGTGIADHVTLGAALKWMREDYGDQIHSTFAFDLGAYFATKSANAVFGLGVRNLSFEALSEPENIAVPKQIRAGVLVDLVSTLGLEPFAHHVDLAIDVVSPFYPNASNGLNVGVEYTHVTTIGTGNSLAISLRGGQKSSVPMVFGGGLEFRTAGGRGISVDYANRDLSRSMSDQRIHVFSVALNL